MVTIDAILLGGGIGKRFSDTADSGITSHPKQFLVIGDAPVWIHALRSLLRLDCVRQAVMAVPENFIGLAHEQLGKFFPDCPVPVRIIPGGEKRQDSSRFALEALEMTSPPPSRVLIHDACRPFLSSELLERIKVALFDRSFGAWIPVVPVIETLKRVEHHQVIETVNRAEVWRVQTPQIFEFGVIRSLVEKTRGLGEINFTDDASLCEYYGIPVGTFEGDVRNIKLTYDFELESLQAMLEKSRLERSLIQIPCASESATTYTV